MNLTLQRLCYTKTPVDIETIQHMSTLEEMSEVVVDWVQGTSVFNILSPEFKPKYSENNKELIDTLVKNKLVILQHVPVHTDNWVEDLKDKITVEIVNYGKRRSN